MASGKSNHLRNAVLNHVLGITPYAAPSTVYLALSTEDWSASTTGASLALSEPSSGSGYARLSIDNGDEAWSTAVGGTSSSLIPFDFGDATSSWGTLKSFYLVDAAVGGNTLWGGDLYVSRTIVAGDSALFVEGQLSFSEV